MERENSQTDPPVLGFDLSSQAFKQNPFPTLARMRELGPVIRVRMPLFGKVWMATTYDAVNDLLRDHHRFVQSPADGGQPLDGGRSSAGCRGPSSRWPPTCSSAIRRTIAGSAASSIRPSGGRASRPSARAWRCWPTRPLDGLGPRGGPRDQAASICWRTSPAPSRSRSSASSSACRRRTGPKFTRWAARFTTASNAPGHRPGPLHRRAAVDALPPRRIPHASPRSRAAG